MKGTLFDIQHFCTGDGPGIRTTVFLKGCPLRCAWCHNPESQSFSPEILLNASRCIACGACDRVCPAGDAKAVLASDGRRAALCRRNGCLSCGDVCPSGCLEVAGKTYSVGEVLDEVLADEAFYRHSGGGMTLSGGEPMAQPAFALALLSGACARGIHTVVETSGTASSADILSAAPYVNRWLWDIKLMDASLYRTYTGGTLERMLENLEALFRTGADILLRILYIPEIHNLPPVMEATRSLLEKYPSLPREVIPYHLLGNAKREKLGRAEIRFREPDPAETAAFARALGVG